MVNLSRKKYVRLLVVALIICLISMIGASLVNTNFGHKIGRASCRERVCLYV